MFFLQKRKILFLRVVQVDVFSFLTAHFNWKSKLFSVNKNHLIQTSSRIYFFPFFFAVFVFLFFDFQALFLTITVFVECVYTLYNSNSGFICSIIPASSQMDYLLLTSSLIELKANKMLNKNLSDQNLKISSVCKYIQTHWMGTAHRDLFSIYK